MSVVLWDQPDTREDVQRAADAAEQLPPAKVVEILVAVGSDELFGSRLFAHRLASRLEAAVEWQNTAVAS